MSKADTEKWALEVFWPAYKVMVETPYKDREHGPGARGECIATIIKLNPSKDLQSCIMQAIKDQTFNRSTLFVQLNRNIPLYNDTTYQSKDRKYYANRHGKTWINAKAWYDETPEIVTEKEARQQGKQCIICGEQTHGSHFNYCIDHLPEIGAAH